MVAVQGGHDTIVDDPALNLRWHPRLRCSERIIVPHPSVHRSVCVCVHVSSQAERGEMYYEERLREAARLLLNAVLFRSVERFSVYPFAFTFDAQTNIISTYSKKHCCSISAHSPSLQSVRVCECVCSARFILPIRIFVVTHRNIFFFFWNGQKKTAKHEVPAHPTLHTPSPWTVI